VQICFLSINQPQHITQSNQVAIVPINAVGSACIQTLLDFLAVGSVIGQPFCERGCSITQSALDARVRKKSGD
jgi:hypothetical protein